MKIEGFLLPSDKYHMPLNQGYFSIQEDFRKKSRLKFFQYVAEGKLTYETISCFCGNDRFEVLATMDRQSIPQVISLCISCGLMLNNPRLDEFSYNFFYSSGLFRDTYEGENAFNHKTTTESIGYSNTILDFLSQNDKDYSKRKKVLEVGCNTGYTLMGFKKAGFEVGGIEPDARACEAGNTFDLNIQCGKMEDFKGQNQYDLVVMTETIEHIYNPEEALKSIKTFLKPNGALYISVIGLLCPTWRDLKKFTLVPHPYNYSLQTLAMVIEANGFRLVAGNQNIQALFIPTNDSSGKYIACKENYTAIREKFLLLEAKNKNFLYRYKEKIKAMIREFLKLCGMFEMVIQLREKLRQLKK
jgi:2-polyprenyl-3-methyl-5-hydroxy-6-metoxy-1,4-benzoquinol methylase